MLELTLKPILHALLRRTTPHSGLQKLFQSVKFINLSLSAVTFDLK